jgi:hypothetical protein
MNFNASEEWLRKMAEREDGANVCIGSLPLSSFEAAGGMRTVPQGRYRYVRYDRRNGVVKRFQPMFLLDEKTWEVNINGAIGRLLGYALVDTKEWTFRDRLRWYVEGRPEFGDSSPIRFFFVHESGFIGQVV